MVCLCAQVADTLGAKAIIVFTSRGTTVNKAAQLRPKVPVRMNLVGVGWSPKVFDCVIHSGILCLLATLVNDNGGGINTARAL